MQFETTFNYRKLISDVKVVKTEGTGPIYPFTGSFSPSVMVLAVKCID